MPDFDYIARELSGKQVTGTLTATSEKDALSVLQSKSLFPMSIGMSEETRKQVVSGSKRVPGKYLTTFYNQLADLLRSGVPLLRSLQLLEGQTSHAALKFVTQDIREQIADGSRLNDAMRRHPKAFNSLTVSMVKAGEEGGFLEDVLARVAAFNDHQEELKGKVTGAMVYPLFLFGVGTVIITVLLVWFVPEFANIFARMREDGSLPWATTTLLSFSDSLQEWWYVIVPAIIAAVFGVFYWYNDNEEAHDQWDRIKLQLPGLGPIVRNLAVARFCRMLGTLLGNGVPILQSLRIAKDASGNVVLSEAIGNAADNVSGGKSLAIPLRASGQFSREIVEMISIGEEANNLENVLIGIADSTEKYTSRKIDVVVRMLEPVMLLFMATIVTFVIAALLLPILNMSTMQ
ncbi:type II secretion system F family protein [Fuerstiella marisgermanici]|uniref:General secretion pathway protein F n=1 Tax=Fuerstiella marisgermanici TaxID=1891926 RepID=A0A1P8WCB3_9PLAN|nr:type II secretion system F family protein [Fuerstiella marisgermanici]APZ91701.1 General secretion pathway protein F [Fuerstiella marisgermanici]